MKYGIIGFTIVLMSCAALGSKTKVYNDTKVKSIKTVGLITKRYDQPRNGFHKIVKESFTRTLIAELDRAGLFRVVVLDTMENERLNIKSYETDKPVDALLIAEWKLTQPYSIITDSKVSLSMVDKNTKELLLHSSHGTKFGNSYWMMPSLPGTLLDATKGAVKTMEKNIRKEKQ